MLYAGVILVVISAITIAAALAVDAYARHGGHRTRHAVAVAGRQGKLRRARAEPEGGRAFIAGSSKPAFVADVESAKVVVRFDAALLAKVDAAAKWQGITRTVRTLFGRVAGADDHESGLVQFVVAETAEDCRVAAVVSPERVMPAVERFGELVERGASDHSATPETPRDPELAAAEAEAAEQAGTSIVQFVVAETAEDCRVAAVVSPERVMPAVERFGELVERGAGDHSATPETPRDRELAAAEAEAAEQAGTSIVQFVVAETAEDCRVAAVVSPERVMPAVERFGELVERGAGDHSATPETPRDRELAAAEAEAAEQAGTSIVQFVVAETAEDCRVAAVVSPERVMPAVERFGELVERGASDHSATPETPRDPELAAAEAEAAEQAGTSIVQFVVAETAEDCRVAAVVSPERVMPAVERFGELVERGAGDHSATPETPRDPELAAAEAEAAEQAGTSIVQFVVAETAEDCRVAAVVSPERVMPAVERFGELVERGASDHSATPETPRDRELAAAEAEAAEQAGTSIVQFVVAETAEDCRVAAVVSPERVMPAVERFGELVERGAGDHSATPETPRDPELAAAEAEAAEQAGTSKSTIWRAIRAGRLSAARTDGGGFAIDPAELFRAFPPERLAERFAGQDATAIAPAAGQVGTGGMADLAIKLAAAEAELRGLKELLAEVKANRDELRQDRDDWRGRAERILTDQRRPWWRRLVG